jgi:hypothetical protein
MTIEIKIRDKQNWKILKNNLVFSCVEEEKTEASTAADSEKKPNLEKWVTKIVLLGYISGQYLIPFRSSGTKCLDKTDKYLD